MKEIGNMLSEFQFNDQIWKLVRNGSYEVISGVYCDNYEIVGDSEQDLAAIHVHPNAKTPRQLIKCGESTIEVFMSGNGSLIVEDVSGIINEHHFTESQSGNYVQVAIGEKMQWIAGNEGLHFVEICKPPYKDGRFENI
jgi:hypothetical protein